MERSEDNLQGFHYMGLVNQKEVIRLGSSGYTELSYGLLEPVCECSGVQ